MNGDPPLQGQAQQDSALGSEFDLPRVPSDRNETSQHNTDTVQCSSVQNDAEQLTAEELLERELVALLSQTGNNDGADSGERTSTDLATDTNGGNSTEPHLQGQSHGPGQPQEQYLTGLAAVLQAMQTQVAVKNVPGFHFLTADSAQDATHAHSEGAGGIQGVGGGTNGFNNDLSDVLAHLTAQLEQAGHPSSAEDPSQSGIANSNGPTLVESNFNFFVPPSTPVMTTNSFLPTVSAPVPVPGPSGQTPYSLYYSGFLAETPGAGPSTAPNTKAGRTKSKGKNEGKKNKKQKSENQREKKSFACEYCEKTFGRKSDALRHMKIHTGDRPFVCPHDGCGKTFIQRSALHVHLRVHSGEKPHMCEYPLCGRTFSDSSSLARHRRSHTGKRPYACNWEGCTKMFTRRRALTMHMRTHDPSWEPDPNVRYNFKPKKRKTDTGEEEEIYDDDDDDEGEDVPIDPTLEESVRTLSTLLSQTASGQPSISSSGPGRGANGTQQSANTDALEARVAAISAEIAAAIAQANIQAQALEEEEESDESDDDEDENVNPGGITHGMNVSGIRSTEQLGAVVQPPAQPPRPPLSASSSMPSSVAVPVPSPAPVSTSASFPPPSQAMFSQNHEEEDDFPVPLRERKSKNTPTVSSGVGIKRKR